MQRQRGGLVPIGEAFGGLDGPVKAIREASPQALHHFTRFDQVNQLRVVCGRGRNPTLSRCPPGVAVQALRFRRRGPSGPAHATGPAVRRTCRASPA